MSASFWSWVVGRDGGIALFNAEKRLAGPRQGLPLKFDYCMLNRDRHRLLAVAGDAVCLVDTQSLMLVSVVDGLAIPRGSQIGLREDGRLAVGYEDRSGKRPKYGVYVVDPERNKAETQFFIPPVGGFLKRLLSRITARAGYSVPGEDMANRFSEPMVWISPNGQWGLRRSHGSLPLLVKDGRFQVGIALEIWRIAPTRLVRRLCVRMFDDEALHGFLTEDMLLDINLATDRSASPTTPAFFPPKSREEKEELEAIQECWTRFLAKLVDVVWESDSRHVWLAFSDGCLRRISLGGNASITYAFECLDNIPEQRLATGLRAGSLSYLEDGRVTMEIAGVGRVQLDSRTLLNIPGPADATFSVGPGYDGFDPDNVPRLEAAPDSAQSPEASRQREESRAEASVAVPVGEATPENCIAAVERLGAMVGEQLPALIHDGCMFLKFDTDDGQLDEAAFFGLVRRQCPDAVPALRSLVEAFVGKAATRSGAAERIWGDERGSSALAHAARALVLMDAGSMPAFKAFIDATSQQYDEFLWEDVVPEIFEFHRWPDRDMLRWGIAFVLRDLALGMREEGRLLEKADMMEGARRLVSPAGFVEMLLGCVEEEDLIDDEERRDQILAEFVLAYLEPIDDFRYEARCLLKARFAEDMPEALDHLAELSQSFNPDAEQGTVTIPVPDLSEDGHIAAIETLTRAMDRDLPAMMRDYFFAPLFRAPDGFMNEADFFDSVRRNAPGAVPALRGLMKEFTERAPGIKLQYVEQMYGGMDEATGALAHAMHALVLMDPGAMPVLKAFVGVMDAEHEEYTRAHVIPGFFKAHGWPDEDRIRFAIDLYLSDWYRGEREYGSLWQGLGMRDAVRGMFDADAFADRVIARIGEGWRDSETDHGIRNFVSGNLDKDDPFDEKIVAAFKARRPELPPLLEPWEMRFSQ